MATKKPSGIDIFSSRTELVELMDAATGNPADAPVVETVRTKNVSAEKVEQKKPDDKPKPDTVAATVEPSPDDSEPDPPAAKPTTSSRTAVRRAPVLSTIEDNVEFRLRIPPELKVEWTTFKAELSAALGGLTLNDSTVGRPVLEVLLVDYKEQILSQAEEIKGQLKRPANGDRVGMAELEAEIADVLRKALKQRRRRQS